MKKLLILTLALLLLTVPAFASISPRPVHTVAPLNPNRYCCDGVYFTIPDGYNPCDTDSGAFMFATLFDIKTILVTTFESDGLTPETTQDFLCDSIENIDIECQPYAEINGINYIDCTYTDDSGPYYGKMAVFIHDDISWLFILKNRVQVTEADLTVWYEMLSSITAPDLFPVSTPVPTATPLPPLDFAAVNRNPEKYKYMSFMIHGHVLQVIEGETDENGYTIGQFRLATDGDYGDEIYCYYRHGPTEDRILKDDLIEFIGQCRGLYTYTSIRNVQISLPLFYIFDEIHILEE